MASTDIKSDNLRRVATTQTAGYTKPLRFIPQTPDMGEADTNMSDILLHHQEEEWAGDVCTTCETSGTTDCRCEEGVSPTRVKEIEHIKELEAENLTLRKRCFELRMQVSALTMSTTAVGCHQFLVAAQNLAFETLEYLKLKEDCDDPK